MKTLYPPDIALNFVEQYYPDCPLIILTGSSKNVSILISDIDLVVFSPSIGQAIHDIITDDEVVFDVMLCPLYHYESMFLHYANNVFDGTLLTMIVSGIVIKDTHKVAPHLIRHAWICYHNGYRGMLPDKLEMLSNVITRRLEFLEKRPDGLDKCLLAYDILDSFLQLYLWYHIGWSRAGKQRGSVVYEVSPTLHNQLYSSLREGVETNDFQYFNQIVKQETELLINEKTNQPRHVHDALESSPNRLIFALAITGDYFSFLKELVLPLKEIFKDTFFQWYILPQQNYYQLVFIHIPPPQSIGLVDTFKKFLSTKENFLQECQTLNYIPPQVHFGGKNTYCLSEQIWVSLIRTIINQIENYGMDSVNSFKYNAPYYLIGFGKGMGMDMEGFHQFCNYLFDIYLPRAADANLNMKYQHIAEQHKRIVNNYENTLQKFLSQYQHLYQNILSDWESDAEVTWLNDWIKALDDIHTDFEKIQDWQKPYIKQLYLRQYYPQGQTQWLWYERNLEVCFATLNLRQQDIAFIIYVVKRLIELQTEQGVLPEADTLMAV